MEQEMKLKMKKKPVMTLNQPRNAYQGNLVSENFIA